MLWTNPNPNASYAGGTVTLSESIDDYDYIKVYAKAICNDANSIVASAMYTIEELKNSHYSGTYEHGSQACSVVTYTNPGGASVTCARLFGRPTDTTITFSNGKRTGTNAGGDPWSVPIKICGIK